MFFIKLHHYILFFICNTWEQRKLGEIVDICSGRDYKHLEEGDIPVYGTGGYMLSVSEALSNEKDAIGIGRKGTIDKPYILKAPFWTVDTLFYCIPREKYHLDFTYDIFQNIDWRLMDESTGVPSLSKTAINAVNVLVPNEEEQLKIGEYFRTLDHLITLHQRKYFIIYNKLITWEQRKVSEYANFFTGNGLNWNDISDDGEQECILYGNLYTDYGMITENIVYRTNTEIKNPVYSEYGDVLIPASDTTPTGLARATSLEKSGVLLGGDINIIRPNEGINGSCLSLALNANRKELIRLIKGTTVRHIHNSEIKDIVICLPKLETEQVRVSSYFKQLDHLITLHRRAL